MHITLQDPRSIKLASSTLQLLEEVTKASAVLAKYRPLPPELSQKIRDTFLPDRIVATLNIEGIMVTRRQTLAVMDAVRINEAVGKGELEILNALRAHEFVVECCDNAVVFSEGLMRELNKLLINELRIDAGIYRPGDVTLTNAHFTPPSGPAVPEYAHELVNLYPHSESLHPVVQAAWLHEQFTYIHPFNDGNGRTGRLLQDWALIRRGMLPVGIPPAMRDDYYHALENADKNKWDELIELIADLELKTLGKFQAIVTEGQSRAKWITGLAAAAAAKKENTQHKKYLVWRTKMERIAIDFEQTAKEINSESELLGTTFKSFGVPSFKDWENICRTGNSERSWLFSIIFYSENKPFYKAIAYIKRHRPIATDLAALPRETLALYFTGVDVPETIRPDFYRYDDPYIRLREIIPTDSSTLVYRDIQDNDQWVCESHLTAAKTIQEFFEDAFMRKMA